MRSSPHLRYYVGGPAHTIYKDHPIIPRRLKNECKYKDRRTSQKRTALYRNLRRAGGVVHHITVNAVAAGQGYGCLLWDSPDGTAAAEMPDNVADVSTGAVADTGNTYIPGIYTTELILGNETVNVEVIVSDHAITSVSLADPSETLTTMYPLLESTMESLNDQLCEMQDPEQVTYSAETRYTSLVLLEAVKASLEKAKPKATPEATGAPDATNAPAASPNVPKADINPAA